eukprot:jgi/Mesen1/1366/ME000013S00866
MAEVATPAHEDLKTCSHCEREIPAGNFDLHAVHCRRNLERCQVCNEMIARAQSQEHFDEFHAPVTCGKCGSQMGRDLLGEHEQKQCPKRMAVCPYCDFPDVCGSRTDWCELCSKYVQKREQLAHDLQLHSDSPDGSADVDRSQGSGGASLDTLLSDRNWEHANRRHQEAAEVARSSSRPRHSENGRSSRSAPTASSSSSSSGVLLTVAVTGLALVVGSLMFNRSQSSGSR